MSRVGGLPETLIPLSTPGRSDLSHASPNPPLDPGSQVRMPPPPEEAVHPPLSRQPRQVKGATSAHKVKGRERVRVSHLGRGEGKATSLSYQGGRAFLLWPS